MSYFVIQVMTRSEDRFIRLASNALLVAASSDGEPGAEELRPGRLFWPRRRLTIRKGGVNRLSLAPIFPGYVFYEAEGLDSRAYWEMKRQTGFIRFLKDNSQIEPLAGTGLELLVHFISFGEIVDKSQAYFDENQRIRITSGPLKGLEGRITKVDKRRGRAKVRLALYEEAFLIDFGFELLETADANEKGKA